MMSVRNAPMTINSSPDKMPNGGNPEIPANPPKKATKVLGMRPDQVAGLGDQAAAIAQQNVAGGEKKGRFDQAVMDQADHGTVCADAADARSKSDDPHVFDAGIGQHAFVFSLLEDKGGGRQIDTRPKTMRTMPEKSPSPAACMTLLVLKMPR
jgi:hypothetical protein